VGLKDCVYKETVEVSLKKGGKRFNCFRFFLRELLSFLEGVRERGLN
jgi:hypothetical protein